MLISKDGRALIGYLSRWGGLSRSGIRNLEERGIIVGQREGDGLYRSFTNDDFLRLNLFQGYRDLEFTQAQALELCSMGPGEVAQALERQAAEVRQRYEDLLARLDRAERRAREAAGEGEAPAAAGEGAAATAGEDSPAPRTTAEGEGLEATAGEGEAAPRMTAGEGAAPTGGQPAPAGGRHAWRIERRPAFLGLPTPVSEDGSEQAVDDSTGPDELAEVDMRWRQGIQTEIGLLVREGARPNNRLTLCELDGPVSLSPDDMGPAIIIPGVECLRFVDACLSTEYATYRPEKALALADEAGVRVALDGAVGRVLHMQRQGDALLVTMEVWVPIAG